MPEAARHRSSAQPYSLQPARGYSWPPFEKGNVKAARHGAFSQALVSERAAVLLAELKEEYAWLKEADAIVLDVLVRAKVRFNALDDYIAGVIEGTRLAYPRKGFPQTGIEAVPAGVWQQISRESRTVLDAAGKLGFTPLDRAQLFKDAGMAYHFGGPGIQSLAGTAHRFKRLGTAQ